MFSPFVLRSKQDAMKSAPKPKLFYGLQETDEVHDTTTLYKPRVREDIKQSVSYQYDRFLTATQDASKSFNHYRPDGIIYRPSQIIVAYIMMPTSRESKHFRNNSMHKLRS